MTPAELSNLDRLEVEYREWEAKNGHLSVYSDERHRLSCAYLRHGPELIAAVAERDALRAENDKLRERVTELERSITEDLRFCIECYGDLNTKNDAHDPRCSYAKKLAITP